MTPLMEEVREMIGDRPCYISFDIDSLDPAYAPGTGQLTMDLCNKQYNKIAERLYKIFLVYYSYLYC